MPTVHGEPAVEDKRLTSKFLKDRLVLIVIHHGDKVIEKRLPSRSSRVYWLQSCHRMLFITTRTPL